MIGKSVPRVDAYEKVTGRAKFTEDLLPKKCLVAKVLHATIGNGIVKSIDTSEAEIMEGVVKVVTFHDVPDHCYPTPMVCGTGTSGCGRQESADRSRALLWR